MKFSQSKKLRGIFGGIGVLLFLIAMIIYFGSNDDITITQTQEVAEVGDDTQENADTQQDENLVPIQKNEFTEFGDFWIEINKEDYSLKAPILEGIEKDDLKRGVGHHPTTALPNPDSGNVVLSGHRWLPGSNPANTVFRHLDKLTIGDSVSIFREGKEYVYRVRESKTVSNDAVEILEDTESPQLTLYTCTPLFTALRRLVYIADLVEVK